MQLVQDFLERTAAATPDATALLCGERRLGYGELDARANRLAHALRARGIGRGDRVVLWNGNDVETVVAIFAVLKAGAVFVLAGETSKAHQVDYLVRDCGAAALLLRARDVGHAPGLLAPAGPLRLVAVVGGAATNDPRVVGFDDLVASGSASRPDRVGIDRDLACLIYTSGSSGQPKGVMSAHHQVVFASGSILQFLGMDRSDVVLCALPLAFDYGLYQLLMTCRCGGTLVLERSFAFPAACLDRIQATRATVLPGVPTLFALLLDLDLGHWDLTSLRIVTNTAAALAPSHIDRLRAAMPSARLFSMYGLTETKRTLYLPPELLDRHPASVGVPIPGTEVWIEDADGRRVGAHEVGELVVRGGHVMSGYWNAPEASAARFRPGPLPGERVCHTGDLFTRDEHGLHYFVGRVDDLLKCRGEKVSPKEVENVLHELPGVLEASVVGADDPVAGQVVVAVIVRRDPDLDAQKVLRHCRTRLEDFKVPRRIEFVAQLPRTATGKVRRADVAASLPPAQPDATS